MYAEAVEAKGAALDNCVGFIDGTKIKMCRPGGANSNQRAVYSGHKRFHALSYQTVTVPDGLIMHLYGPVEGRQPDCVMYGRSGLDGCMEENFRVDGKQFCIYGDAAYVLREWLVTAYPRHTATAEQQAFNVSMNRVRTAVEYVRFYCGTSALVSATEESPLTISNAPRPPFSAIPPSRSEDEKRCQTPSVSRFARALRLSVCAPARNVRGQAGGASHPALSGAAEQLLAYSRCPNRTCQLVSPFPAVTIRFIAISRAFSLLLSNRPHVSSSPFLRQRFLLFCAHIWFRIMSSVCSSSPYASATPDFFSIATTYAFRLPISRSTRSFRVRQSGTTMPLVSCSVYALDLRTLSRTS
eukprot:IDg20630t1